MELPLFLITGFHPAGFILGYIFGMADEVKPVFCMKTNDLDGLQTITADRLHVVGSPFEIPLNGIGIGRFMDAQCNMRDGYETYNELQAVLAAGHVIHIAAHPAMQMMIDAVLPYPLPDVPLTAPVDSVIIPQEPEPAIEEKVNDDSGHVVDDSIPSGEPEGDGSTDTAGSPTGTITVGKRPKG